MNGTTRVWLRCAWIPPTQQTWPRPFFSTNLKSPHFERFTIRQNLKQIILKTDTKSRIHPRYIDSWFGCWYVSLLLSCVHFVAQSVVLIFVSYYVNQTRCESTCFSLFVRLNFVPMKIPFVYEGDEPWLDFSFKDWFVRVMMIQDCMDHGSQWQWNLACS